MSGRINTILIIGATSGIGEAMARRFHSMGKKVIAAGISAGKLTQLAQELPGLETHTWDVTDLANLQGHVETILSAFPTLDTVFINAGIQNHYMILQPPKTEDVVGEVTTNLIAPSLIAQSFAPHLLALAQAGTKTNLFLTSSSLAYFPLAFYPTYCATKAGISAFAKIVRMQLSYAGCKDLNVVEIVPPYVDTPLNAHHREQTDAMQGGKDKAYPPMPLADYIDGLFAALEQTDADGSFQKEIGVGLGAQGVAVWRNTFPKLYEGMGITI